MIYDARGAIFCSLARGHFIKLVKGLSVVNVFNCEGISSDLNQCLVQNERFHGEHKTIIMYVSFKLV